MKPRENRNTYDLDAQDQFSLGTRQTVVWGLGYRRSEDKIGPRFGVAFNPPSSDEDLLSLFVQDQLQIIENRLFLTVGSKFERKDFSGNDVQATARLLWTPQARQALWTAVSRAVRTPNRVEETVNFSSAPVPLGGAEYGILTVFGNDGFDSESLTAYEAGYRVQPVAKLSLDLAGYYNR